MASRVNEKIRNHSLSLSLLLFELLCDNFGEHHVLKKAIIFKQRGGGGGRKRGAKRSLLEQIIRKWVVMVIITLWQLLLSVVLLRLWTNICKKRGNRTTTAATKTGSFRQNPNAAATRCHRARMSVRTFIGRYNDRSVIR